MMGLRVAREKSALHTSISQLNRTDVETVAILQSREYFKRTAKPAWNEILHENAYTPVQNWHHLEKDYDSTMDYGQRMTSTCSYKGNQTLWPNNSFFKL